MLPDIYSVSFSRYKIAKLSLFAICVLMFSPLFSFSQITGATINNPIIMGTYAGGTFTYSDTKNNSTINGYGNEFGQSSDDIYYRFTVQAGTQITISHCGSQVSDTYLWLLNSSGSIVASDDDYGPSCSSFQASLSTTLTAGTYY
ncbi:MAG TPA: PPC domain-containing protein, partial [Chitinophagaceae bacterium]